LPGAKAKAPSDKRKSFLNTPLKGVHTINKDQVHKKAAASRPLVSLHEIIGSGCALFYFDKSCFCFIYLK
jgi:hypothetical protein